MSTNRQEIELVVGLQLAKGSADLIYNKRKLVFEDGKLIDFSEVTEQRIEITKPQIDTVLIPASDVRFGRGLIVRVCNTGLIGLEVTVARLKIEYDEPIVRGDGPIPKAPEKSREYDLLIVPGLGLENPSTKIHPILEAGEERCFVLCQNELTVAESVSASLSPHNYSIVIYSKKQIIHTIDGQEVANALTRLLS